MQIKTQEDLIQAVWINCNRISVLGSTELYQITHREGEQLPPFYTRFLNKNFSNPQEYNSFFAEINKIKNKNSFMKMLSEAGGFMTSDILLGALSRRQSIEIKPEMEYSYEQT